MLRARRSAWPAAALLLLACAHATAMPRDQEVAPGVCKSIDARGDTSELLQIRGCQVIEGHLSIVLMDRNDVTFKSYENMTFPELREVTGYIKIYRMKFVRNLGDMFPNLSVVRGLQLFRDYALVVFDNEHIEMLGLHSLTTIENGAVRIQNNDRLCYADTIDWDRIVLNGNSMIKSNYDTRLCGLCPNAQIRTAAQCPRDPVSSRLLCWDDKHCQKVCPSACGDRACTANGTCCHAECLGGCDGPSVENCHVCRHFSLGYGPNRTCTKTCPRGFYELFRRCVTEQECRKMKPPSAHAGQEPAPDRYHQYKTLNGTKCVWDCPAGYTEKFENGKAWCRPCAASSGCVRECEGGKVDSLSAAEAFRGCTRVKGSLEIAIRASGGNTMSVLEETLGEIREIDGCLKVSRSNPLVSLMFLKNLEKINVRTYAKDNMSRALHIFTNENLELLWDWENHRKMEIVGKLYMHQNPKLCYEKIKDLSVIMKRNFTEEEVGETNGHQGICYKKSLDLRVSQIIMNVAVLTWNKYCVGDSRQLLGYSIYYIVAEQNVTLYGNRDACSDSWNVIDIPKDEAKSLNSSQPVSDDVDVGGNQCEHIQPLFKVVPQLIPFTRYAAYVKTITTMQSKEGAQSEIVYFRTLPGRPSPPQALSVESLGPHSVYIKWSPPAMPNSSVIWYHVEIQANSYNKETITAGNINYCGNPNALVNLLALRTDDIVSEKKEDKAAGDVKNGSCSCREEPRPFTFTSRAEQERQESIQFENALQNSVYVKTPIRNRNKSTSRERTRRSIDNRLNMLVIVSKNNRPTPGVNYTNTTDEQEFVKSLYYELDAKTRTLTVEGLRHYTWYTVNVWACREKHVNESNDTYNASWCSDRPAYNTFRTQELANVDVVRNVRAEVVPSNKTLPEVNITWQPPLNPNGFVVAYNVHFSRVEDSQNQDPGLHNCITASECKENVCGFVLRKLMVDGNYSVRVTPVTVSGAGNVSTVTYVEVHRSDTSYEWVWALVGACVIGILMLGGGIWYARRGMLPPAEANKLFASVNPEYVSTVYVPDEWEVPRANIELVRELGQGSFGMVYEGIARNIEKGQPETRCAVKTVNEHATDRERIEFLNEASVMKAFDTHHVVRLLGVVSRGQPTLVIMELMERGDLKTYLRSHRPDAESSLPDKEPNTPPTLQNILQMAIEIADGMAYLSAKKFVHRDLAARNCMVAGDLTVKVGDFGMTRDIYETDYYRKGSKGLLPVRWMSPESLKDGVFSSGSDVWSYGVVLWEMATLAMQPYQGLSNEQVVRYVVEGGVMERPDRCPDRLYELMRACWAHRPAARPSFLRLAADLAPYSHHDFRQRSFFHSPLGQELYALQRSSAAEEEAEEAAAGSVSVGAVALGSASNLFGVSVTGRLASWARELSSLRSRGEEDAAEPLQPALKGPNGVLPRRDPATTGC